MQYYERIRKLRECNSLSKRAVACKLNISVNTYRDYESNRRRAPVGVIISLARLYDCSVNYPATSTAHFPRHDCSVNYMAGSSDIYGSFPEA